MTSFETFQATVEANRTAPDERIVLPVCVRKSADLLTPVSAFLMLRDNASHAFLLESVEGGEKLARYSFLGRNPYKTIEAVHDNVVVRNRNGNETECEGTLFDALRDELSQYREVALPDVPRFSCGAVGFLSYDTVRVLERLPSPPPDDLNLPDGIWAFYDTVAAFDHVRHQIVFMSSVFLKEDSDLEELYDAAIKNIGRLENDLSGPVAQPPVAIRLAGASASNVSRPVFESAVERAREYIREGDIFQVVLSQRFALDFDGDAFNLYRALRQINPSPYLFFLQFPEFTLVGSSPEVLVRVQGQTAEVLPIAGTRPRGASPEADAEHERDLLDDPKERAEHLMLVDLGRNDLGRVAKTGSVHVDRYAYVERFSHVMHIVSAVSATLKRDVHAVDVLAACFPAGTVTGAPKVRAMEIIDELETTRRGVYAGAVGYVSYGGELDTCITIRTMLVSEGTVYVQAGAGIVADSDPAREYEETINKARALQQAIQVAAEDLL